jgi:DNA-binding PadR family transcriptional regulator
MRQRTFEEQSDRSTWEPTEGRIAPTIVTLGKDGLGKAKHPHWRHSAHHRKRLDALAKDAHKHVNVRPAIS